MNHKNEEWACGAAYTNTFDGYFSIFGKGHEGGLPALRRKPSTPLAERIQFQVFNRIAAGLDEDMRTRKALKGITGKRLTYQQAH